MFWYSFQLFSRWSDGSSSWFVHANFVLPKTIAVYAHQQQECVHDDRETKLVNWRPRRPPCPCIVTWFPLPISRAPLASAGWDTPDLLLFVPVPLTASDTCGVGCDCDVRTFISQTWVPEPCFATRPSVFLLKTASANEDMAIPTAPPKTFGDTSWGDEAPVMVPFDIFFSCNFALIPWACSWISLCSSSLTFKNSKGLSWSVQ